MIEALKVKRSRIPLMTAFAFLLMPLVCALLMLIYKDPDFARKAGLISAKADVIGGSADWPSFLSMLSMSVGVAGIILFSFIQSWVFGREFSDHTSKDLLAVPVRRTSILAAKFIIAALWSGSLSILIYIAALILGSLVKLPQGSMAVIMDGSRIFAITTSLVILVSTPTAFIASIGRGYLAPLGGAILMLVGGQIAAVLGWGDFFPWSIPAMFSGANGQGVPLPMQSYWIVYLTSAIGIAATFIWWQTSDQNR